MKTTGETALTKLMQLVKTALAAKAPTSHASSATKYGKGTSSAYGHVKLSDSTTATTAAASGGTAATPKAVSAALEAAKSYADSVAGGTAADYVVEQGTSGIWTYRKWSSGIAECWGAQSYSNISVSSAWGSVYESAGQKLTFPSGLFTAAPDYCSITYGGGSEATLSIEPFGLPSKTETQTFCLTRAAAATITNAKVQVHAIGRWK